MTKKKSIITIVFVLLIATLLLVFYNLKFTVRVTDPTADKAPIGGLQAEQISTTEVSIKIPEDFINDVEYLIIRNDNGDAESYIPDNKVNKKVIELKKIKLKKNDHLTVTMYNAKDDALGEYKEIKT